MSDSTTCRELALRRHWGGFPVCPADVEAEVGRRLFPAERLDPRGTLGTPAFHTESLARWLELSRAADCLDAAHRLAIHRAALTVIAVFEERYPSREYAYFAPGGLIETAFSEYHSVPWMDAGIDLDTYVRDAVELVIWRELSRPVAVRDVFFAIPRQDGDRVDAVLASIRAELPSDRYPMQKVGLLRLWASFVVMHKRYDDFVRVARMLGLDTCATSVQMLVDAALGEGNDDLALAVFAAANQRGEDQPS